MRAMERSRPVIVEMSGSMIEDAVQDVLRLLASSVSERDQWVRVLGSALVAAAIAPYWADGETAGDAHARMQLHDTELARVVEALAPMLYSRELGARAAAEAVAEVEGLLGR